MIGAYTLRASVLVMLCCDRGPFYRTAAVTAGFDAEKSLTSQVGGYAVFECPLPANGYRSGPHVVKWIKDVSAFLVFVEI